MSMKLGEEDYYIHDRCRKPYSQCDCFTAEQRERLIDAAIATEALSGFTVPRDVAEAAFDAAMRKPLPRLDKEDAR